MNRLVSLKQNINNLKSAMYKAIDSEHELTSPGVVSISQSLDKLLTEYEKELRACS